jgi:hypothetical protein
MPRRVPAIVRGGKIELQESQDFLTEGAALTLLLPDSSAGEGIASSSTTTELSVEFPPSSPLVAARLAGERVQQELLFGDGQPLPSPEVAQQLGISVPDVDVWRIKGAILGVPYGDRGYLYPAWQFQDGIILPGLDRVLKALAEFDPWMQLMFIKTGDIRLEDRTPKECIMLGDIDAVVHAAECYGEQIAS